VLLFVGKLAPWKRPQDVLDALERAQAAIGSSHGLTAVFAGDGALADSLKQASKARNLRAIFAGFVNVDVLPACYAMADVLVFPSEREPYGLSAREAICVGLPLIVSDQIGCVGPTDAARPDYNALVYPTGDITALARAIVSLTADPVLLKIMGEASLAVAADLGLERSLGGFMAAVDDAQAYRISRRRRRAPAA